MSYWRNMTSTVSLISPKSTILLKEILDWMEIIDSTKLHVLSYSLKIAHISRKLLECINKAATWPITSQVLHLTLFIIHVCLLIFHFFQFPYASVRF